MSLQRRFGDLAAHSVGLPHAPLLATRSLRGSQVAIALLSYGPKHVGRTREIPPENSFLVDVHLAPVDHRKGLSDGSSIIAQPHTANTLRIEHLLQPSSTEITAPQDIVSFYIPQAVLTELADGATAHGPLILSCPAGTVDPVMNNLVSAILPLLRHPSDRSWLFVDQLALAVVAHCALTYGGCDPRPRKIRGGLSNAQVEQAKAFLAEHLGGDILLADVARVTGLSRGHFIRAFALTTGITPHRWLQRHRVEKAKSLLLESNVTIAEIALACGFADQSHLTRSMKLLLGINPAALRKQHRTTGIPLLADSRVLDTTPSY